MSKTRIGRLLSQYGMLLVLFALCVVFSIATNGEQSPTGATAARELAEKITGQAGPGARVLIAMRDMPDDAALADALQRDLDRDRPGRTAVFPDELGEQLVEGGDQGGGLGHGRFTGQDADQGGVRQHGCRVPRLVRGKMGLKEHSP